MSLDFAILADDDGPVAYLPLPIQRHHARMADASELHLTQFLRFKQYDQDVAVAPEELMAVGRDVDALFAATGNTASRTFLTS